MSLTSVGVQDRSTSSSTRLVSVEMLCCWACLRLDSSRDSICSWHDRRQSCEGRRRLAPRQRKARIAVWLKRRHTYRVAPDDLREEVGEVLRREGTVVALQVQALHRRRHAARRDHGGRARDEVNICERKTKILLVHAWITKRTKKKQ